MFKFTFVIEAKKNYYTSSSPYEYSNSAETQQELFDVSVPNFSNALAMDKILTYERKAILLELSQMLGYKKMCDYAKQLGGEISEEEMFLLIDGIDIEDVIMIKNELLFINWNNTRCNTKYNSIMNEKWNAIWPTIKDKAADAISDILDLHLNMLEDTFLDALNERLSKAFDNYVPFTRERLSYVTDSLWHVNDLKDSQKALAVITHAALQTSNFEMIRPSDEEMGSLKFISLRPNTSKNDEDDEEYSSMYEGSSEETFFFKPIAPCTNRVIVVKGSSSSSYCDD